MEKDYLVLKGASASRPSGNDDDNDVLAEGIVVGRIMKTAASPAGTPWLWTLAFGHHENRTPHPRICRNPRGRHGSVREELAAEARSLGKIGHHDQDAPQRDQHSKPERGGPYYQAHVHYST